jgi:hypothetical protein
MEQAGLKKEKKDNPLVGIILGLVLWCLVPVCLWNNERIAIKQYKMQFKAERWAIHIDEPERAPIKDMDGRIVYVSGVSKADETLTDAKFPQVKSEGKIKLRRHFQMYQWVEKSREEGDGDNKRTVYYWEQAWSDHQESCPNDSSGEHQNPPMPLPSSQRQKTGYRASSDAMAGSGEDCAQAAHEKVCVGSYYLGELVIRELMNWKTKDDVTAEMLQENKGAIKGEPMLKADWWYFGGEGSEKIGDVRVQFEELLPGPISIVGVLTETKTGWTFAPIKRPDAAGTGDNVAYEICGSCCVRVKELHYVAEGGDDEFKTDLEGRPVELTDKEKTAFRRADTAVGLKEYAIEDDFGDLCCVGPFGGVVIKLMHWLGLEEEFLAVRETKMPLDQVMDKEGGEAANRHHMARLGFFLLLVFGSYLIIAPAIKLLNYNWMVTLLGGGLISAVIICAACLCTTSAFCCIVSTAWIVHRPFLATLGITCAVGIGVAVYFYVYTEEQKKEGHSSSASASAEAAFLATRHVMNRVFKGS